MRYISRLNSYVSLSSRKMCHFRTFLVKTPKQLNMVLSFLQSVHKIFSIMSQDIKNNIAHFAKF